MTLELTLSEVMFDVPFVNVIPSSTEAIAIGTVAAHWCEMCQEFTTPVPMSNALTGAQKMAEGYANWFGWIHYPCHQWECGNCWNVSDSLAGGCIECEQCADCHSVCDHCEKCRNACTCVECDYCSSKRTHSDCGCCSDHCSCFDSDDERCYCSDCVQARNGSFRSSYSIPGWIQRGDQLPTDLPSESLRRIVRDLASNVDPAESMATFYLLDYITAFSSSAGTAEVQKQARAMQAELVNQCDNAFRLYALMAIGGELRHHCNVSGSLSGSREAAWDIWWGIARTIGTETALGDAVSLFSDKGAFPGSNYGGDPWRIATEILLARETGKLDPRSFVDRCFSLQHHGGSFLNKVSWKCENGMSYGLSDCVTIGNAHDAIETDLGLLMGCAAPAAVSLFRHWWKVRNEDLRSTGGAMKVLPQIRSNRSNADLAAALGIPGTEAREIIRKRNGWV